MCRSLILEDKLPNHMVLSPEVPGVPCLQKCLDDPDEEKQAKQIRTRQSPQRPALCKLCRQLDKVSIRRVLVVPVRLSHLISEK